MITTQDKAKIKALFGGRYSREIKDLLDKKGLKNKDGNFHSSIMIRSVMNGLKRHHDIETAIFELVEEKQQLKKARQKILK
ncbi:MAG: hypothetical protein COB81_11240 [Flavobacteriaceae bacterium]|nr:MAG: hypothetical protein COB81_11240 [Flavobacteriaceae bacterium]